ncbi:hypothetical protein SAMN04487914_10690 [Arthrobacter sp. ok909]|uniref:hypothetical protein n=1 Tax=Arthrobacter sp. ok909 TaxID=1761746 RepID=UPI0008897310|nr:hypothetical protein [Arthrobacter sp. ok909]SDP24802.1 hypothetical protein SAMN04487914_10690 [Arthrobacter sp. ok909]
MGGPRPIAPDVESCAFNLPFTATLCFDSRLSGESVRHLGADTFEDLAEAVTSEVTVAAILERAGELTMLHACGVADPEGAVIALVAKSGTGKTTASSQLARTLGYITDETVAIRTDGTVVPYPKPLSVKQATPGAAKLQVGPDELGLRLAPDSPRIKAIALLDRIAGGDYQLPVIEPVPLVEAVLALIPDTSSQAAVVQPLQSLCRLIDSVGGVFRVSYSEAADLKDSLAPLFLRECNKGSEVTKAWTPALAEPETEPAAVHRARELPSEPIPAGWLRRCDVVDAVEIGDDLLVLTETELTRLSGIGPVIWQSAQRPVSMQTLASRIEARHGLPDGYEALLEAAVDGLVGRGLLLRG